MIIKSYCTDSNFDEIFLKTFKNVMTFWKVNIFMALYKYGLFRTCSNAGYTLLKPYIKETKHNV